MFGVLVQLRVLDEPIQVFLHRRVRWHAAQSSPQTQRSEKLPRFPGLLRLLKFLAVFAKRLNRQAAGEREFQERVASHFFVDL